MRLEGGVKEGDPLGEGIATLAGAEGLEGEGIGGVHGGFQRGHRITVVVVDCCHVLVCRHIQLISLVRRHKVKRIVEPSAFRQLDLVGLEEGAFSASFGDPKGDDQAGFAASLEVGKQIVCL